MQTDEALSLRLLRDVHEELRHEIAVVDELPLEVGRRGERAAQRVDVALIARLGDGLGHRLPLPLRVLAPLGAATTQYKIAVFGVEHTLGGDGVPAAVVERDGSAHAKRLPELLHGGIEAGDAVLGPREGARGLHVEVLGDVHARGARVEVVHEIGDAASLAGAVPPLEQHDEAHTPFARLLLQHDQALHERIALLPVLVFRQRRKREVDGFQHGSSFLR